MRSQWLRAWVRQDQNQGAAVWGICCCWLVVLVNYVLLGAGVPIAWVIPADIIAVPTVVTVGLMAASRA